MAFNERTSETVASKASRILHMAKPFGIDSKLWADMKSVAGSALTQTPDKSTLGFPLFKNISEPINNSVLKSSQAPKKGFLLAQYKAIMGI